MSLSETLPLVISMPQQCRMIYNCCLGERVVYFMKGTVNLSLSETLPPMVTMSKQCGMIYDRCLGEA